MAVHHCFPAAGTVRSTDERISRLYQKTSQYIEQPRVWEGLFRLACLIGKLPAEEPVADMIRHATSETENGSFSGSLSEQICTARAAMAVFEYSTDRSILKRVSEWLRYVEIEYDDLVSTDDVLFRPADFMELLVRFYLVSGFKPALRLCAKLRADAFDWTTAIHTFQQSIPVSPDDKGAESVCPRKKPEEIDYDEKERLINHAEMLADGVRYTLFAGIFSGHGQDLTAGETVWPYLLKHHYALCGGTTGSPYLSGTRADQTVNNRTIAAWTEAFSALMCREHFTWAAEELIRIVFNGLDDCLNQENISETQRINSVCEEKDDSFDPAGLYARIARAAASAYSHAVSLKGDGICINYLLPGRYLVNVQKQAVLLQTTYESAEFRCKKPARVPTDLYLPGNGGFSVCAVRDSRTYNVPSDPAPDRTGHNVRIDAEWNNGDMIRIVPDGDVFFEEGHHQGISFRYGNRLLCMRTDRQHFAKAVCGTPRITEDGRITVPAAATEKWKMKRTQPADIPVLPDTADDPEDIELIPYSECRNRITMFPRKR